MKIGIGTILNSVVNILSWIFGILFLLMGILFLFQKVIAGLSLILISILIFPPVVKKIRDKLNIELSKPLKVIIIIILLFIYSVNIPPTYENEDIIYTKSTMEILPTLSDMPVGTRLAFESINDNHSERIFVIDGLYLVKYSISKYTSVAETEKKYNEIYQTHSSEYSVKNLTLGEKGFYHPVTLGYFITFYSNNIGVTVTGDYYDTLELAKKVHLN